MTSRFDRHRLGVGDEHLTSILLLLLTLFLVQPAIGSDKDRMTRARAKIGKADKLLTDGEHAGAALVGQHRYPEALGVLDEAAELFVTWEDKLAEAELKQRQLALQQSQEFEDLTGNRPVNTNVAKNVEHRIESERILSRDYWKLEQLRLIPPQLFYLRGISYLRTSRREQGIEQLELCLELDDQHGLAHYNLAVARFLMGDPAGAKLHLDAAVAAGVEPQDRFVADLGAALEKTGG
jgi:tetratricopeptide (TPR) repeat protein